MAAIAEDVLEPLDALGILGRSLVVFRQRWFAFLLPNVWTLGVVYLVFFSLVGRETIEGPMLTLYILIAFFLVSVIPEAIVSQMVTEMYADMSPTLLESVLQVTQRIVSLVVSCLATTLIILTPSVAVAMLTGSGFLCILVVCTLGLYSLAFGTMPSSQFGEVLGFARIRCRGSRHCEAERRHNGNY